MVYHVVNRAVDRHRLFTEAATYAVFLALMAAACRRYPVDVLAYCIMPNHWHLVLRPAETTALSAYMKWLTRQHVVHHRRATGTVGNGHVYQGRFRSSVIDTELYYWNVFRYVESNPVRAHLVDRAEEWEWGSLFERERQLDRRLLTSPLLPLPPNWPQYVNNEIDAYELSEMRQAFRRCTPYRAAVATIL